MSRDNNLALVYEFAIKVNGIDLDADTIRSVFEVTVDTTLTLPNMAIIRAYDPDLSLIDGTKFPLGGTLQVDMFNESRTPTSVFKGEITALEPEFETGGLAILTVRGYDKSHRLNRETKVKAYMNSKDSDIVSQLVSGSGLTASVTQTSQVHEHVYQDNQTNWEFIQMLARRNGFEVQVDDTTLYFRKPSNSGTEITLKWGMNLIRFNPRLTLAGQVNEVTVKGWDPKQKREIIASVTSSTAHPQVGYNKWGGQAAQSSFAGAAKHIEVRRPVESQSEAQAMAQAILDEINAGFLEADGVAFSTPELVAGKIVKIENIGTKFGGKYVVTSARHVFSNGEMQVEFTIEGPRRHLMSDMLSHNGHVSDSPNRWVGVVTALVTNNADPQQEGRVKLKYPWLDSSQESGWARVSMIGAGSSQGGLQWMPEVNDEVLVAFEHGDFNRPYVLGGVWNGQNKPPEADVESGKVEVRSIRSRAGHIIRMTDKEGSEKIEIIDAKTDTKIIMDTANKTITVDSKDKVEIKSAGDTTITASKQITIKATEALSIESDAAITIKGASVAIEGKTGDVTIKGKNVTAEGTQGAKIKGGMTSDVEGATVNIKGSMAVKLN